MDQTTPDTVGDDSRAFATPSLAHAFKGSQFNLQDEFLPVKLSATFISLDSYLYMQHRIYYIANILHKLSRLNLRCTLTDRSPVFVHTAGQRCIAGKLLERAVLEEECKGFSKVRTEGLDVRTPQYARFPFVLCTRQSCIPIVHF